MILFIVLFTCAYAAGMAWACRGAFCDQYGDPGPLSRLRAIPGRYFDRAWALFDAPHGMEPVWS